MKKIFTLVPLGFLLLGCGGSGGSSSINSDFNKTVKDEGIIKDISMIQNINYTVSTGDKIIKTSPNALVRIVHIDGSLNSSVTLIEGSATIIVP